MIQIKKILGLTAVWALCVPLVLSAQQFDAEMVSLDTTRLNAYLVAQAEILRQ